MRSQHWKSIGYARSSLVQLTTFRRLALWAFLLCSASSVLADDNEKGIYTDPANAPVDYKFQGEYVGRAGEEGIRYGAQIIALGDGKFHLVGYAGGLPGEGWDPATGKVEMDGALVSGELVFSSDQFEVRVNQDGALIPTTKEDGTARGELNRVERVSPTMGAKPPAGAIVLFDGTSADAFNNGKLVEGQWLLADCQSVEKFGDHSLHLEFRTPFKPAARGQARGNSGVYVQSRYEIQVLDSFGLSGENNECGGIYQIAAPKVNMCFPPLQWQTYDIDFTAAKYDDAGNKTTNARVTIRHNGVVIHENLELPRQTPGKDTEANSPGALYLQGHGNPVVYRNIWVVPKS